MRAVTVPVSATSGVAGFVFPGDRVDLVLTQEVEGGGDGPPLHVSETIIRNIRVLAIDQRINTRDEEGNQVAQNSSTVTFEATPKIAEKIAVAQTIGQLSLSLRSIADNEAELERAIASGEVQVPETDDPQRRAPHAPARSRAGRSTRTRPTRSAPTSPASSAAPCPAGRRTGGAAAAGGAAVDGWRGLAGRHRPGRPHRSGQ